MKKTGFALSAPSQRQLCHFDFRPRNCSIKLFKVLHSETKNERIIFFSNENKGEALPLKCFVI
jgi:hypothetical protein